MSRLRALAVQNLREAAAGGVVVFNRDYNEWKQLAGRAFEDAVRTQIREPFFYCGKYQERTAEESAIDDAIGNLAQFPSKKLRKAIEAADNAAASDLRTPMVTAVDQLITEWQPVADAIKAVKPNVVKGRRPSDSPTPSKARTIDNTGTCAVCGRNVKLRDGKIVAHGYQRRFHAHMGNCFGVGYDPIEVSTEGAEAYMASMVGYKDVLIARNTDEAIAAEVERSNGSIRKRLGDERLAARIRANLERDIRNVTFEIERVAVTINEWAAKPLPGTN